MRVDPGQVEQVVMNLVVNARDAMPQGGRLTVEAADAVLDAAAVADLPEARPGAYVMLSVSDTGSGMAPEVRARIFEPYFTTKDVGKGTGLGLSTVYGIIRQSDGHISLSSELGLGTTFRIYLPRAEAPAAVAADQAVEKMPDGTEHILLVEDDPSVRRLSKELLLRLGYSVTDASSGRAGLALGSDDTRHFDLALCDVILGDMSGPAVAEALSALAAVDSRALHVGLHGRSDREDRRARRGQAVPAEAVHADAAREEDPRGARRTGDRIAVIGETISHYKILSRLGAGGMGVVYEAEDTRLGRKVAIKFLPDEASTDAEANQRFQREARVISSLNHPYICTLYDIGSPLDRAQQFMVMELLDGQSLKDRIARGALPLDEVLELGAQLADALDAAHAQGVVHRDIKPANLFVTRRGSLKVLDFGVAKLERSRATVGCRRRRWAVPIS